MYPSSTNNTVSIQLAMANLFEDSYLDVLVLIPWIKNQSVGGKSRSVCRTLKTICNSLCSPFHKPHFSAILYSGGVFIGFQLWIVVWEFIEQDGDWHAVENNSKRDARKCKNPAQMSLWKHIAIAHSGDAHLWNKCTRNTWMCSKMTNEPQSFEVWKISHKFLKCHKRH